MDDYTPDHRAEDAEELPPPASLLFGNRAYELVRAFSLVILPGLATLYFTVAEIVGLPYGAEVTAITAAVCTFLGLLLTVSRRQYNNSDASFDGNVILRPGGPGKTDVNVQVSPLALEQQGEVLLKVVDKQ